MKKTCDRFHFIKIGVELFVWLSDLISEYFFIICFSNITIFKTYLHLGSGGPSGLVGWACYLPKNVSFIICNLSHKHTENHTPRTPGCYHFQNNYPGSTRTFKVLHPHLYFKVNLILSKPLHPIFIPTFLYDLQIADRLDVKFCL